MKKNKWVAGILIAAVLLCLGVGIGFFVFGSNSSHEEENNRQGIQLDKDSVDIEGETAAAPQQISIKFPGYPDITIKKDSSAIPIVLTNPEGNPCYFQFSVSLDGGEAIYNSQWVEPGKAIQGFSLDTALEPGDYEMKISISTRSLEDQSPMNGGSVKTMLHVTE